MSGAEPTFGARRAEQGGDRRPDGDGPASTRTRRHAPGTVGPEIDAPGPLGGQETAQLTHALRHGPRVTEMTRLHAMLQGRAGRAPAVAQRMVSRGQGTGWGFPFWVEGGEALWKRIDTGFNTDLLSLHADLIGLVGKKHAVRVEVTNFVNAWDNKSIYFKANPAAGQHQSASDFAQAVEALVAKGRAAVQQARNPVAKPRPPETPVVDQPLRAEQEPTSKAAGRKARKRQKPPADAVVPVADTSVVDEGPVGDANEITATPEQPVESEPAVEQLADTTEPSVAATLEPTEPVTETPVPKKASGANKRAAKKAAKAQEDETARLAREKAAKEKAARKVLNAANTKKVEAFATRLKEATSRTVAAERISLMPYWLSDIDPLVQAAVNKAKSGADPEKAMRVLYDAWSAVVDAKRTANAQTKQGSQADWQTWTGLDDYRIIKGLNGARFTPALPPVEGPALPDGTGPVAAAEPIDIHVTYDRQSVGQPAASIQGKSAAEVADQILSAPANWQRIHATLEVNDRDNPHVYWGGSDLGLGAARYRQWDQPVPPGWVVGPEGASARAKVQQVLHDFVDAQVVTKVQLNLKSLQFKETPLPDFANV